MSSGSHDSCASCALYLSPLTSKLQSPAGTTASIVNNHPSSPQISNTLSLIVYVCPHHVHVCSPMPPYVLIPSTQAPFRVKEKSKQLEFAGAVKPEPGGDTTGGEVNEAETSIVSVDGSAFGSPLPGHGRPGQHNSQQPHAGDMSICLFTKFDMC